MKQRAGQRHICCINIHQRYRAACTKDGGLHWRRGETSRHITLGGDGNSSGVGVFWGNSHVAEHDTGVQALNQLLGPASLQNQVSKGELAPTTHLHRCWRQQTHRGVAQQRAGLSGIQGLDQHGPLRTHGDARTSARGGGMSARTGKKQSFAQQFRKAKGTRPDDSPASAPRAAAGPTQPHGHQRAVPPEKRRYLSTPPQERTRWYGSS